MQTEKPVRYSIGLIYILFGGLKLLGEETLNTLIAETIFFLPLNTVMPLLGIFEVAIGVCFIYEPLKDKGLYLLAPHMIGTFTPFILTPERMISHGLTLEAHYILKNIIILTAAFQVQDEEFLSKIHEKIPQF